MVVEQSKISVGELQNGFTEIIGENSRDILIYLAIMVPFVCGAVIVDELLGWIPDTLAGELTSIVRYSRDSGPIGLIIWLATVIGHYVLFERILLGPNADIPNRGMRIFGFIGLAIISYLGVGFATIFLVIPGIFVAGRWLLAPAFFVSQGGGVFSSLGQSWDHVRGNTRTIVLAFVVLALLFLIAMTVLNMFEAMVGLSFVSALIDAIAGETFGVALIALSASAYRLLAESAHNISEVFE